MAAVHTELQVISARLAQSYPAVEPDIRLTAVTERDSRTGESKRQGWMLLAICGMVLLIACANVISLQMTRVESRRKEFATRFALGGSSRRLFQQLLTENVALVTMGLLCGLLIASWVIDALPRLAAGNVEGSGYDFRLDSRIMVATGAAAFVAMVVFGLAAGWRTSKLDILGGLKSSDVSVGRQHGMLLRDVLVVAQVALSMVLLVGAGLFIRTLFRVEAIDPGFNAQQPMLLVDLVPGLAGYEGAKLESYYHSLLNDMNALPGVAKSALAVRVPFGANGVGAQQEVLPPGVLPPAGQRGFPVNFTWVGPEYFGVIGTRLLAGRGFTDQDGPNSLVVAVVNQTLAKQLWPDGNAVGQPLDAISIFDQQLRRPERYQVVGVVEDSKWNAMTERPRPILYLCLWQGADSEATLLLRTHADPALMVSTVRQELLRVDKNVPMLSATTLRDHVERTTKDERNRVVLSSAFGALGLLLSAAGIYGLFSYFVTQRTREIGLRIALGARQPTIMRWILARGFRLVIIGVAVGLTGATALARMLVSLLYAVRPFDPLALTGGMALLVAIAAIAIYVPARRASDVDPMDALRSL